MQEEHEMHGRREYDAEADIVDTTHKLTYDEVAELKRLAQLSKTTRAIVVVLLAVVSAFGFPALFDMVQRHLHW